MRCACWAKQKCCGRDNIDSASGLEREICPREVSVRVVIRDFARRGYVHEDLDVVRFHGVAVKVADCVETVVMAKMGNYVVYAPVLKARLELR